MIGHRLPWDITEAADELADASREQQEHQETVREAIKSAARTDQLYRVALARRIGELRDAGKPATLCDKLARGDEQIAEYAAAAARAEGDREVAVQESWRLHANRRAVELLADWSKRRNLAEGYGDTPGPEHESRTFGARRAPA